MVAVIAQSAGERQTTRTGRLPAVALGTLAIPTCYHDMAYYLAGLHLSDRVDPDV